MMPAIIRISPTVAISMPWTEAFTAYLRIAPTAMRAIEAPMVMGITFPPTMHSMQTPTNG